MNDLRRNGSGYVDQTAYKAIKNLEGVKEMERGEIWEIDENGQRKTALVILSEEKFSTILILRDEKKHSEQIPILARQMMYVDPAMLSWKFNQHFVSFIRKMKDDEFTDVMKEIVKRLGVPVCDVSEIESLKVELQEEEIFAKSLEEELDTVAKQRDALEKRLKEQCVCEDGPDTITLRLELKGVETERDLYKKWYEKLLDKLVER